MTDFDEFNRQFVKLRPLLVKKYNAEFETLLKFFFDPVLP